MSAIAYDRHVENLGNMVELGHVNITIPDQILATAFYISGLGLTRDPYLMTGIDNMWVNIGRSQFHLPAGKPQVLRGRTGLLLPEREALMHRLERIAPKLARTQFAVKEHVAFVDVTCPWGNRYRCHFPGPEFGALRLGMPYVEFDVPPGAAAGIARFYTSVLHAPAELSADATLVSIAAGPGQLLRYRETDHPIPPYLGEHVQVTLADFSGPHERLLALGLVTEESDQHQYRFQDIVDPEGGNAVLFTIEHEVRSMRHPLFNRPLVNRNPAQTNRTYRPGHEELSWSNPIPV
jgi:hypothetical protein